MSILYDIQAIFTTERKVILAKIILFSFIIYMDKVGFRGVWINRAAKIESNILLNKGITDIGGFVVPQAIMSNNKDESIERVFKSSLYFVFTFLSPFLLLPLINKHNLNKVIKDFNPAEKRILEVSKEYLTKDGEYLKKGVKETAKKLFNDEHKFDSILEKFPDLEVFRKKLINAHTNIHVADFLTTNLMVASIPWIGNAFTRHRTKRSGYSGTYKLADEEFTSTAAKKHDKTKRLRQIATFALAILPAVTIPQSVKKGMLNKSGYKWFNKNANKFDYKDAIFMSRLTGLAMWLSSDYFPYQLASRDKYEYRDCLIRGTSIGLVFWGGDLLLKRGLSKMSDKIFKTQLTNPKTKQPYSLTELKKPGVSKRTAKAGVALYALNLLLVSATLGFGLPFVLNKLLKKSVEKDKPLNFNFLDKTKFFK